jgi:hypothetical protein
VIYHCPACPGTWALHEPPTREQLAIIGDHMLRHHPRPPEGEHELGRIEDFVEDAGGQMIYRPRPR